MQVTAQSVWHDRVVTHLLPVGHGKNNAADDVISYIFPNVNPDKGGLKIGGGGDTLAIITKDKAVLRASIVPQGEPTDKLVVIPNGEIGVNAMLKEVWENPPVDPYVVIMFTKANFTTRNLRFSTKDLLVVNGKREKVYDLRVIRKGVEALQGPWGEKLFEAQRHVYTLEVTVDPIKRARAKVFLDKLEKKYPGIGKATKDLPSRDTPETEAVRICYYVNKKNGANTNE